MSEPDIVPLSALAASSQVDDFSERDLDVRVVSILEEGEEEPPFDRDPDVCYTWSRLGEDPSEKDLRSLMKRKEEFFEADVLFIQGSSGRCFAPTLAYIFQAMKDETSEQDALDHVNALVSGFNPHQQTLQLATEITEDNRQFLLPLFTSD